MSVRSAAIICTERRSHTAVFLEGNKMVVAETLASLNAAKTAFDKAKALQNIHDASARDRAVIDLQREILLAL